MLARYLIRGFLVAAVAAAAVAANGRPTVTAGGPAVLSFSPDHAYLAEGGSNPVTINIMVSDVSTPPIPVAGDGIDNDGDTLVDEDPIVGVDNDRDGNENGTGATNHAGNCKDGLDNDGDGKIDAFDNSGGLGGCRPFIDEDNVDYVDEDGDHLINEDPPPGQPGTDDDNDGREGGPAYPRGTCDDSRDNDGDTLFDLADPDCSGSVDEDPVAGIDNDGDCVGNPPTFPCDPNAWPSCKCSTDGGIDEDPHESYDNDRDGNENGTRVPNGTGNCKDGIDNDGDTKADWADSGCAPFIDEDPVDSIDNDGDTLIDEDPVESYNNDGDAFVDEDGADDDRDGRTNEDGPNEDGDGHEDGAGFGSCDDGIDNGGDHLIDHHDPDCQPFVDEDGSQDNDGDGLVDEDRRDDDFDGTIDEDGPPPCLSNPNDPFSQSLPCGLGAYDVTIVFNQAVVSFESIANAEFLGSSGRAVNPCSIDVQADRVSLSCWTSGSYPTGPQGSGRLAQIAFSDATLGSSALQYVETQLLDARGRPILHSTQDGIAAVIQCADVPTGNPPERDGCIGITTDVVEELKHVGAKSSDPDWEIHAPYDLNEDGGIGIATDVVHMLRLTGQCCTAPP